MAEGTLGLLFEISADPSKAEVALERLRAGTGNKLNSIKSEFQIAGRDLATWTTDFQNQISGAEAALMGLRQTAALTFERFAQGMGMNIAVALVYSRSINEALAQVLKNTLANITSEALVRAILETAKGFASLAAFDFRSAELHFQSAAIFGSISGASGAAGAAIPDGGGRVRGPARPASPGPEPRAGSPGSSVLAPGAASAVAPLSGNLTVMVMGDQQAAAWLTDVINSGVQNYNLPLIASKTKRP